MALIKEDFYPKPPTRESWLDALPELLVAASFLVVPWFGAELALTTLLLEAPFLMFLFVAAFLATGEGKLFRWIATIWAALFFLGIIVVSSIITKQWSVLYGLLTLLVAHVPVLAKREKWLQRDMMGARAGLRIALLYGLLFASPFLLAPFGRGSAEVNETFVAPALLAAWGALYFGIVAALDVFRILVPPDPKAGPGWWKWPRRSADA